MKIAELRLMLWTGDLKGTIDFYVDTLGFTCGGYNEDWGWATLRIDDVGIMLSKPNEHMPHDKIGFTGPFHFNTDGVDSLWERLKDKAKVCYGIEDSFTACASLPYMTTTVTCCSSARRSKLAGSDFGI